MNKLNVWCVNLSGGLQAVEEKWPWLVGRMSVNLGIMEVLVFESCKIITCPL